MPNENHSGKVLVTSLVGPIPEGLGKAEIKQANRILIHVQFILCTLRNLFVRQKKGRLIRVNHFLFLLYHSKLYKSGQLVRKVIR